MNTPDSIHNAGAERHPEAWFATNIRACEGAAASGLVPYSELGKVAIPRIVLRVLDGLKVEAGMTWDKTTKTWIARKPETVAAP